MFVFPACLAHESENDVVGTSLCFRDDCVPEMLAQYLRYQHNHDSISLLLSSRLHVPSLVLGRIVSSMLIVL